MKGLYWISWMSCFLVMSCTTQPVNTTAAYYNIQLGLGYLQQGNISRAEDKLLLAMRQAPTDNAVYTAKAYFFEKTGEIKLAEQYYLQAIQFAAYGTLPKGTLLNNYGVFLCSQKRYQQAHDNFLAAVRHSNYAEAATVYENMGLCLLQQNAIHAAQYYFKQALERVPTSPISLLALTEIRDSRDNGQVSQV